MRHLAILCLSILMLQGCDAVEDMTGMFEKQASAQELIKSKYGWESQLGFQIQNGILTHVTVVLNAEEVRSETVEHLESITKDVVETVFKSTPQAIYIQIASQPDDSSET